MYFDDEGAGPPRPGLEAPGASERAKALQEDPARQALAALEFDASARLLVTKSIGFGQPRAGFLSSMADYWDTVVANFAGTARAAQLRKDSAAATTSAPSCEHIGCSIEGPHEHVTGGPDQTNAAPPPAPPSDYEPPEPKGGA